MSEFPLRPDHPDFWLLAAIVQDYDMVMDDAQTDQIRDRRHANLVSRLIDGESLAYLAMQRAMRLAMQRAVRMVGTQTRDAVRDNRKEITMLASTYYEGVLVGIELERRRAKKEE